jgi:hypothetical protein
MKNYDIEVSVTLTISLPVRATNEDDAAEKADKLVEGWINKLITPKEFTDISVDDVDVTSVEEELE